MTRRTGRKRKPALVTLALTAIGPTRQRLQHAEDGGQVLAVETYRTDAGERTQLQRMRIVSPLERMWKDGLIGTGQYGAARRYQRDADLAAICGPASTVRYEPRWIDGGNERFLLPIEAAADHLARLAAAQCACPPEHRRMLDWIAADTPGWREQARIWFGGSRRGPNDFLDVSRETCSRLEQHYRSNP
jgi:hypothetical protein